MRRPLEVTWQHAVSMILLNQDTDLIMACPSTITGSIGVAAMRPTLTEALWDKLKVNIPPNRQITWEHWFTGSRAFSSFHELEGKDLERFQLSIDETYDDFKKRVCEGRDIDASRIEELAGGRVFVYHIILGLLVLKLL